MAKYVYPAIFTPEEKGSYSVVFPDLDGCYTCGDDLQDAIVMAEDVLAFYLYDEEKSGKTIPPASVVGDVKVSGGEFANYVACDTEKYAKAYGN